MLILIRIKSPIQKKGLCQISKVRNNKQHLKENAQQPTIYMHRNKYVALYIFSYTQQHFFFLQCKASSKNKHSFQSVHISYPQYGVDNN